MQADEQINQQLARLGPLGSGHWLCRCAVQEQSHITTVNNLYPSSLLPCRASALRGGALPRSCRAGQTRTTTT